MVVGLLDTFPQKFYVSVTFHNVHTLASRVIICTVSEYLNCSGAVLRLAGRRATLASGGDEVQRPRRKHGT